MTVTQTLKEPAPFLALMITLACGIAVIAALAISLLIGGALNSVSTRPPEKAPAASSLTTTQTSSNAAPLAYSPVS